MRVLLLILLLSGCSALNPLDLLKPSSGIEAKAQIGKTNQIDDSLLKVNTGESTTQTADAIVNTKQESTVAEQINNTNIPMSMMLLFGFACWVSPSPQRVTRNVTNFCLMLCGRPPLPKE